MSEAEASRFMNDLKEKPELINDMKPYRENPSEAYAHVRELGYDATTEEIRDAYLFPPQLAKINSPKLWLVYQLAPRPELSLVQLLAAQPLVPLLLAPRS